MRLRHLLAVLALVCAQPASAANTVDWVDVFTDSTYDAARQLTPGQCVYVRFTDSNPANDTSESKLLYVGGLSVTVQSDGDAAAGGASTADLYACSTSDGNKDGVQDVTACAGLGFRDSDSNGSLDDNTLDGGASIARGTLTPMTVAGWIYVDPEGETITGAEVMEVTVCAMR